MISTRKGQPSSVRYRIISNRQRLLELIQSIHHRPHHRKVAVAAVVAAVVAARYPHQARNRWFPRPLYNFISLLFHYFITVFVLFVYCLTAFHLRFGFIALLCLLWHDTHLTRSHHCSKGFQSNLFVGLFIYSFICLFINIDINVPLELELWMLYYV